MPCAHCPSFHMIYRDTVEALVYKDLRLHFDGNRYCVPPRFVGRRLTLKADSSSITIYDRVHEIVSYPRCWRRGQTLGADRFEAELAELRPAAKRSQAQQRLFAVLENLCSQAMLEAYLRDMADTDRALSRQLTEISGTGPPVRTRTGGRRHRRKLLRPAPSAPITSPTSCASNSHPRQTQPPLRLRDPRLNDLATDPLSLLEYDAFILDSGKESDDATRTETEPTDSHRP